MTMKTWLAAVGVLGLVAASIALLTHGCWESGTLALALALAGVAGRLLWKWKL